jgi:hypothetical protein
MIPLKIVSTALLTYAVCVAAGQLLLTFLKLKLWRPEWWFLGFVLGSACFSTLLFFLAAQVDLSLGFDGDRVCHIASSVPIS